MPGRLTDKVAIVTGASSGIGRAISLHYASEGAKLVCADLQPTPLDSPNEPPTHELIASTGGTAIFHPTDVSDATQVSQLVATAAAHYGRLDIMVNNAGIGVAAAAPVWDLALADWERMQAVNLSGVFHGIKFASAQMLRQPPHASGDRGWIVNAASILGLAGQSGVAAYCAAKGGVVNLTRAAALDCAPQRIHVNAFAPGYTGTAMTANFFGDEGTRGQLEGMHPFRGLGEPEDLARVCVFLASEDARWVTGVSLCGEVVGSTVGVRADLVVGYDSGRWWVYGGQVLSGAEGLRGYHQSIEYWTRMSGREFMTSNVTNQCVNLSARTLRGLVALSSKHSSNRAFWWFAHTS